MNEDILELVLTKNWCGIDDLMIITGLSRSSAIKIKSKIKEQFKNKIHTRDLPMSVVVDYLNIDIDYLKKITTRREKINEDNK